MKDFTVRLRIRYRPMVIVGLLFAGAGVGWLLLGDLLLGVMGVGIGMYLIGREAVKYVPQSPFSHYMQLDRQARKAVDDHSRRVAWWVAEKVKSTGRSMMEILATLHPTQASDIIAAGEPRALHTHAQAIHIPEGACPPPWHPNIAIYVPRNDHRVKLNGQPPLEACRVMSEPNYQLARLAVNNFGYIQAVLDIERAADVTIDIFMADLASGIVVANRPDLRPFFDWVPDKLRALGTALKRVT